MKYKVTFKAYGKVINSYTLPTEYEAIRTAKSYMSRAMGYRSSEVVINKESDTIKFRDTFGRKIYGVSIKVVG